MHVSDYATTSYLEGFRAHHPIRLDERKPARFAESSEIRTIGVIAGLRSIIRRLKPSNLTIAQVDPYFRMVFAPTNRQFVGIDA